MAVLSSHFQELNSVFIPSVKSSCFYWLNLIIAMNSVHVTSSEEENEDEDIPTYYIIVDSLIGGILLCMFIIAAVIIISHKRRDKRSGTENDGKKLVEECEQNRVSPLCSTDENSEAVQQDSSRSSNNIPNADATEDHVQLFSSGCEETSPENEVRSGRSSGRSNKVSPTNWETATTTTAVL